MLSPPTPAAAATIARMEIIPSLIVIGFGIAVLVIAVQWIAAILMLVIPLSPERRAALIQELREEREEYRRRDAKLRAAIFEQDQLRR